jgi:enoyl-CoA hydratase/carnithine racemase
MDMLLTGRSISAEEAHQAGLVSRLVPIGEARVEAIKVCEEIVKMSRSVTALGKAFYYSQSELKLAEAYRMGETVMVENLKYKDCQEGIEAFIQKRSPKFEHTDERVL